MIQVLLAEDMPMIRSALAALLGLESDIEVVAEVGDGDAVLPAALRHRPHVAVLDVNLPGRDGVTAAQQLHEALPSCGTVILTSLNRPAVLRRALEARTSGLLLKEAPSDQLVDAIRRVASGARAIDPQLALDAWELGDNPLTKRETEVLRLTGQGADPKEIARTLFLSAGTVANYLATAAVKLNARNRIDAVRIASEAGWLS